MTNNHERLLAEGWELMTDQHFLENTLREYIVHPIRLPDGSYYAVPMYCRLAAADCRDVTAAAEETFKRRGYGERLQSIKDYAAKLDAEVA